MSCTTASSERELALTALDEFMAAGAMPEPDVAERIIADLERVAAEAEAPSALALARICRSTLAGRRGALAYAVALGTSALELVKEAPRTTWHPAMEEFFVALAAQHIAPDYGRMATAMWQRAIETEPPQRFGLAFAAFAGLAHARDGDERAARWALDCVTFGLARDQYDETEAVAAIGLAAEAVFVLDDEVLAARLQSLAEPLVERGLAFYMSQHDLTLARLAAAQRQPERAGAAFGRARQALTHGGQRPLRAIVDHDEATILAPGTARTELLHSARDQFAALGMDVWAQRAREAESSAERNGTALTRREVEVLRLLAAGSTNRQIAERLVLSVHTVERHVNNVYRKIGVRNRSEATVFALRRGL